MRDICIKKISSFLHDPLDKPFILMQGEGHAKRADELAKKIGVSLDKETAPDHIASAMERAFLPQKASKNHALHIKFLEKPCIKHPLSAKNLEDIESVKNISVEEFKKAVDGAFNKIKEKGISDNKKMYFFLWRNLLHLIKDNSKDLPDKGAKIFPLAPADTRIPDHSIFEHLKISAACFNSTYAKNLLLNNCSLFLFSIGPVQSFIAQARKAQDLYWGSFILSYLNWKAIKYIANEFGPDSIIFPDILGQPFADYWLENDLEIEVLNSNKEYIDIPTIPNRFLAILPDNGREGLEKIGKELENRVKEEFRGISEQIVRHLQIEITSDYYQQIENFFNIFWVAVPWAKDEKAKQDWENELQLFGPYFSNESNERLNKILNYAKENSEYRPNIGNAYGFIYSFAEKSLASRKNLKTFRQEGEIGRKCSICGERIIRIYRKIKEEENEDNNRLSAYKLFTNRVKIIEYGGDKNVPLKYLQHGEGLCAVCFTKRCAEIYFQNHELFGNSFKNLDFPSVANIALAKVLKHPELKEKIKEYAGLFGTDLNNFEAQLLYEENLTEMFFQKNGLPLDKLPEAQKGLKNIKERIDKNEFKLTKYYAVLALDGDEMGKWLAGAKAPFYKDIYHPEVWENLPDEFKKELEEKKRLMTPALHSAISNALKNYSLQFARWIVEEKHDGRLIYAGGDDVLAFVNLEDLLDAMVQLRAAFSGHIDKDFKVDFTKQVSGFVELAEQFILTMGPIATASAGVCIAHYKTPLQAVIETARKMMKKAKEGGGRNAFAISILKHSGQPAETCCNWFYSNVKKEATCKEKLGTMGILKNIIEEFKKNKSAEEQGLSDTFVYVFKKEFSGLLGKINEDPMIRTEFKRLLKRSCQIKDEKLKEEKAEELTSRLYQVYIEGGSLQNFFGFLDVAVFLCRGE